MARTSRLEKHEKFILEELSGGRSYVQIAESLVKKGCDTSSVNVFKWVKRRAARILRAAAVIDPLGYASSPSPAQIPQEPPRQVQAEPVVAPQKMAAAPSAVPASGATQAVNPANPAAALKPKLGREDVDISAVDALIEAGESLEDSSQPKPGIVLGKK